MFGYLPKRKKMREKKREKMRERRKITKPDTRPIPVADGWAGAEMRDFRRFNSSVTDQPTDRRTDGQTDRQSLL